MQEYSAQLKKYYECYYPFASIEKMASVGNKAKYREIAYYWQAPSRWHCSENLKASILAAMPWRLEMGSVYSVPVEERAMLGLEAMVPTQKELVFDIDIDEHFDDLRCCGCMEKKFCAKCWPLVTCQAHLIDVMLRELYDFEHVIWIYSGRRGVHCWVLDKRAMQMAPAGRHALAENFANNYRKDLKSYLLDSKTYYSREQSLTRSMAAYFLQVLRAHFKVYVAENPNLMAAGSRTRNCIDLLLTQNDKPRNVSQLLAHPNFNSVALHFCYPNLDVPVTQHIAHLLKLPFCVHPSTFSISVPIYMEKVAYAYPNINFDFGAFAPCIYPKDVPNFLQLCQNNDEKMQEKFETKKKFFDAFVAQVYDEHK